MSELSNGISATATLFKDNHASQPAQAMRRQRCSSEESDLLAVRANLISSVKWLSLHVPVCVLNRLGDEICLRHKTESEDNNYNRSKSWSGDASSDESTQEGHTPLHLKGQVVRLHDDMLGESLASRRKQEIFIKSSEQTFEVYSKRSNKWEHNKISMTSLIDHSQRDSNRSIGDISELSLDFKSEEETISDDLEVNRAENSTSDDGKEINTQDISTPRRPPSPNNASQRSYSSQPCLQLPNAEKHE